MRKFSLLLVLCIMLVSFVSCGDDIAKDPVSTTETNNTEVTTEVPDVTEAPTEGENETEAPETPQDKWTQRY